MSTKTHPPPLAYQVAELGIGRGSIYDRPRPVALGGHTHDGAALVPAAPPRGHDVSAVSEQRTPAATPADTA